MDKLIEITTRNGNPVVSARELFDFLDGTERFSRWFARMAAYGFEKGLDYTLYQKVHPLNNQEIKDYALTLDCAKEIAMLQRSEKGKQARKYFIDCEKKLKEQSQLSEIDLLIKQAQMLKHEKERIDRIEQKVNQIVARPDYFTIAGFGTVRGKTLNLKMASELGRKAAKLCKERGIEMDTTPDPRFGKVKMYPAKVLEEVFG